MTTTTKLTHIKLWMGYLSLLCFIILIWNFTAVNLYDIGKYFLYNLVFIFIPGISILLLKYKKLSLNHVVIAYPIGLIIEIITFMVFSLLGIKEQIFSFYVLIFIGSLVIIATKIQLYDNFKYRKIIECIDKNDAMIILIFSYIVSIFITFEFILNNPLPEQLNFVSYHKDLIWSIGNAAEIFNHYPPQLIRIADIPFKYYYFESAHLAALSHITAISIPVIFFRFDIFMFHFFLIISGFLLGKKIVGTDLAGTYFLFFIYLLGSLGSVFIILIYLYNGSIIEFPFLNVFFAHIFVTPTTFLFSLLFLFPLLIELVDLIKYEQKKISIALLLTFGLIGAKGIAYPMILSGVGGLLIYDYMMKKRINVMLLKYALISSLMFGLFYIYLFSAGAASLFFKPGSTVASSAAIGGFFSLVGLHQTWLYVCTIPLHFIAFYGLSGIVFFFVIRDFYKRPKACTHTQIFLISMTIPNILLGYIFGHGGQSQLYFLMYILIPLSLLTIEYLGGNNKIKTVGKRLKYILILIIILSLSTTLLHFLMYAYMGVTHDSNYYESKAPDVMSKKQYEGLNYLRLNSDKNSIVLSNRYYIADNDPRYFYNSAFSERRFVLEGWGYANAGGRLNSTINERKSNIDTFFDTTNSTLGKEILDKYNASYVIVDKQIGSKLYFDKVDLLVEVFNNSAITIYRVDRNT